MKGLGYMIKMPESRTSSCTPSILSQGYTSILGCLDVRPGRQSMCNMSQCGLVMRCRSGQSSQPFLMLIPKVS